MIEIKFFVLIRGAFTPPPMIDEPVMNMPLNRSCQYRKQVSAPMCIHTMRRRPLTAQCTILFQGKPMRVATQTPGIVRPAGWISRCTEVLRQAGMTDIEGFPVPCEE